MSKEYTNVLHNAIVVVEQADCVQVIDYGNFFMSVVVLAVMALLVYIVCRLEYHSAAKALCAAIGLGSLLAVTHANVVGIVSYDCEVWVSDDELNWGIIRDHFDTEPEMMDKLKLSLGVSEVLE